MMFTNSLIVLQEFSGSHQSCKGVQGWRRQFGSIVDHFSGGSRSLLWTGQEGIKDCYP